MAERREVRDGLGTLLGSYMVPDPAGAEFVVIGGKVFNRDHIVVMSNKGRGQTVVTTMRGDIDVDQPLALSAKALGMGDFDEAIS